MPGLHPFPLPPPHPPVSLLLPLQRSNEPRREILKLWPFLTQTKHTALQRHCVMSQQWVTCDDLIVSPDSSAHWDCNY